MFPTAGSCRLVSAVLFIGGLALLANGSSLHAQSPGTVDPVFGSNSLGLTGNVSTIYAQADGKVLVGGGPTGVVRLNADGSLDTSFHVTAPIIAAGVTPADGVNTVRGIFAQANGKLSRLNADGSTDASFNATLDGAVRSAVVRPDGRIVLSGLFTQVNGTPCNHLARLNADGSLDAGFQASVTWLDEEDSPNETCMLTLQANGQLLLFGSFIQVDGVDDDRFARLNADGSLDTGFQPYWSGFHDFTLQPDGKIIAADGGYDYTEGEAIICRMNADGSLDASFQPAINGRISTPIDAMAVQPDGKILIGGGFDQVSGVTRLGIARLNADGSLDPGFNANVTGQIYDNGSAVKTLALRGDGSIFLGGLFTQVNGAERCSAARLDASGNVDPVFVPDVASGPNAPVYYVARQSTGKVIVSGDFSQVNGVARHHIARLNADGSLDTGFQVNLGGDQEDHEDVAGLASLPGDKVLIRKLITDDDGTEHIDIFRVNTDGTVDASFDGTPEKDLYLTADQVLVQPGGKIVLPGPAFQDDFGDSVRKLVRLNADGSADASFDGGARNISIYCLATQADGKLLAGGVHPDFYFGLVRLSADGVQDPDFPLQSYQGVGVGYVAAVAAQPDGRILINGGDRFEMKRNLVARLNSDGSLDPDFLVSADDDILSMVVQPDGQIVLGGKFTHINGVARNYLARLNPDGSLNTFSNLDNGMDSVINALAVQPDGKVLVGGGFTSINGVLRNYVARLNGNGAPDFFGGAAPVGGGFYYLQFPNGNPFGYYNVANYPVMFHVDMGFEYFIDAQDGHGGAYLYDFRSNTFFYTSPTFPFPYLYDFTLKTFLYYYPDPTNPQRYNTNGVRYFYNFATRQIISK